MHSASSSSATQGGEGRDGADGGEEPLFGEGGATEDRPDLEAAFDAMLGEPDASQPPPPPPPPRAPASPPRAGRAPAPARGRPRRASYEEETTQRQLEFFRNLPPAQKWWLRRVGPKARGDGTEVQCGIYPQPVHGKLTVEAIFGRIGGGSIQVCAGDDPHVNDVEWLGPVEILGEPRVDIDLDATRKRAAAQNAMPAPAPARASEDDPERLVEVYDAERGLFVKVPRSQAQAFGRPTKPAVDPALAALLAEMRESNRQNADAIKALAERVAAPPAPAQPATPPGHDYLTKELIGLLKSERAAAREAPPAAAPTGLNPGELLRYALDALKPSAQPKPLEGINSILELAERLADMRSGRSSEDRFDKVFNKVSDGLGRFYSTAENPLMKILDRVAEAIPVAPPPAAGAPQIEHHADQGEGVAEAPASGISAAPKAAAAPRATAPAPQGLALLALVQKAADGFCDMLDGKVAPEAFWQELSANAPPQVLQQVREVDSAGAIEAALVKMAKHPVLATRAPRLREVARRATGDGRAIAERFVELIQGGAPPQGAAPA